MFLGIPHIEPPIGNLKFRKPVPYKRKWHGVLETKDFKPACMSDPIKSYHRPDGGQISEDCLYINVYTNKYCLENQNCSVMAVVHGGGMTKESTSTFHNDVIINNFVGQDRNIVVVTIPYRLGVWGMPNLPGNMEGIAEKNLILYDVIEGLEWIRREIKNFGGDSNKTTFFGHSGGAIIGTMLSLSSQSDHLYQKMIVMSLPLLMSSKLSNSKIFEKVAKRVGCDRLKNKELIECLREIPPEKMLEVQGSVFSNEEEYFADFAIDGNLIKENPRKIIASGNFSKRPFMIGTVPYEIMYGQYLLEENKELKWNELNKLCQLFAFAGAYEKPYGFMEECLEYYGNAETAPFLVDDIHFHVPAAMLATHHASEKPTYLYRFSYSGIGPAFDHYRQNSFSPIHSEDFIYIMGVHRTKNFTEKDMHIEKVFTGMIADFVNFEKPYGDDWQKLNPEEMNFFDIDFNEKLEMPGMKYEFYKKAIEFWNEKASESGGSFTYSEESSPSFDVFPLFPYCEVKNIIANTTRYVKDKNEKISRKIVHEISNFIAKKKNEFDSTNSARRSSSFVAFLAFSLLLALTS